MTFEPVDYGEDEYELAATRPRPRRRIRGRRAARRRYAILGALAEHGPANASELCQLLHRASGTIYPDLAVLEADGRVVAKWATQGSPRRRLYRLPTDDERRAHRRPSYTETFHDPALLKPPPSRWAPRPADGT